MANLKSPFKFLDAYTKEDADIFFGREKEIEELYQKIFNGRILVVYGSSGTGKTSLIQCGLAAKFADSDWMPILLRRGDNINSSIKKILGSLAITPLKAKSSFKAILHSIYLDYFKPIYLIFDQFEELFIFGNDEEIETFIDQLNPLLEAEIPFKCIFVIRGEYLENLALFEDKLPEIFNNRIRLERMTRKNAARVITEPSKLYNIEVEEGFIPQLLDRFGGHKATIELTYLQVFLDKLYKKSIAASPEKPAFTLELLESVGKIDDVLGEFLDEQLSKTDNPENAMAILKAFVSGEGTKKPITLPEVVEFAVAIGANLNAENVDSYLRKFVDLRILKDKDENGRYELRHDSLAGKIFEHISLGEKELLEVRQFLINRYNDYEKRKTLLEEKDLNFIAPYLNKLFLNDEQKQFVTRSQNVAKQKRNRKRNIAIIIGSIVFCILSGFTLYSLKQKNEAYDQKKIADQKTREALNEKEIAEKQEKMALAASQKAMSADSFAVLQSNLANEQKKMATEQEKRAEDEAKNAEEQKENATKEQSIAEQKSKEAMVEKNKADSAQEVANKLRLISISQTLALKSLQIKDPDLAALLAYESYRLAKNNGTSLSDPQLYSALYSASQKTVYSFKDIVIKENNEITAVASSSANIYSLSSGSRVNIYDSKDFSLQSQITLTDIPEATDRVFFSKDGNFVLESTDDKKEYIWDLKNEDKKPVILSGHRGLIRAAAFTNSINLFATGARDSSVIIWKNLTRSNEIRLSARVKALEFSPDFDNLIIGCEDGTLYIYNLSSDNKKLLSTGTESRIQTLSYSNEGNMFAAGFSNGTVELFNSKGQSIRTINGSSSIEALCLNEKQDIIVISTLGESLYIYPLSDKLAKPTTINDIGSPAKTISFATNGFIYLACKDNGIRRYALNTSFFESLLKQNITRNFTTDEWNTYLGSDIPYDKIKNN